MKKLFTFSACLLLLLNTSAQKSGTLDSAFAGKGWLYTDFKSKINNYNETGGQILLQSDGSYIIAFDLEGTVLTRYFPNGTVDTSFGTQGYTYVAQVKEAKAALQKDGKIVLEGYIEKGNELDFVLARITTSGSLDSTFHRNGTVTTNLIRAYPGAYGLAVQEDGKIVVAGSAYNSKSGNFDFAVARYNTNGSLDSTFNHDGITTVHFGFGDIAYAVTVQKDGKIVVAGSANGVFAVVRLKKNGTIDKSFDKDGKVTTGFNYYYAANVSAIVVQEDGKIAVAGTTSESLPSVHSVFALARYNVNGSPDSTFGKEGKCTTYFGVNGTATSMALQKDGKIVVAGYADNENGNTDFALARFKKDGSLDSTFGHNGKMTTDFSGGNDQAYAVVMQSDGKLVTAGYTEEGNGGGTEIGLCRHNPNGSLDRSFDEDGKLQVYYPVSASELTAVAVQNDGRIVVAGYNAPNMAIARYNSNGTLDTTFGKDGIVLSDFRGYANAVGIQKDGKILVAGYASDTAEGFALARYTKDGSLDSTFGENGTVITSFAPYSSYAYAMALQADEKIVLAGYVQRANTYYDFAVVRYNSNETLDSTFGNHGTITTDFGGNDYAYATGIQSDGKIVVAGYTVDTLSDNYDIALARYNTDGTLDSSFDKDGMLTKDIAGEFEYVYSLAIQRDDKLVVGGSGAHYLSPTSFDFVLARINTDGTLDSSFGNKGVTITDLSKDPDYVNAVAIQGDGKIIAAGWTYNTKITASDVALARYNRNGTLDSSFGTNGKLTSDFGVSEQVTSLTIYRNRLYVAGSSFQLESKGLLAAYHLDCAEHVFYKDVDKDGFGDLAHKIISCSAPKGYVVDSTDCDDQNAAVYPGAEEICGNGIDDNCNGQIDEGCPTTPLLSINDTTVYESAGVAILTVTLSQKVDHPVYVPYFTVDETARSFSWFSKDYKSSWGVLTIPAGEQTATISITIYEDNVREPDEYFDVYIFNLAYIEEGNAKGRVTIKDGTPLLAPSITRNQSTEQSPSKLSIKAYPNPSTSSFTLVLQSACNAPITLRINDAVGRTVDTKAGVAANTILQLGSNYPPGIYFFEATQGTEKVSMKLVKQYR